MLVVKLPAGLTLEVLSAPATHSLVEATEDAAHEQKQAAFMNHIGRMHGVPLWRRAQLKIRMAMVLSKPAGGLTAPAETKQAKAGSKKAKAGKALLGDKTAGAAPSAESPKKGMALWQRAQLKVKLARMVEKGLLDKAPPLPEAVDEEAEEEWQWEKEWEQEKASQRTEREKQLANNMNDAIEGNSVFNSYSGIYNTTSFCPLASVCLPHKQSLCPLSSCVRAH